MSQFFHYVVAYDEARGEFYVDEETTQARFPEGIVWDDDQEKWMGSNYRPSDDMDIDAKLRRVLANAE